MRTMNDLRIGFFEFFIILMTFPLLLAGCGMPSDSKSDAQSAESISLDGDFSTPIPPALQKHRQDEALTARGLVDGSQIFVVTLDHATERFSANIPELSPGMHKFEILFFRGGVLFATLTANQEIISGQDTPILFDAASLVYAAAPKVDWTDPFDTQFSVNRSTKIIAGFSQPLNGATVRSSTAFTVSSAAGPLSGTTSYLETPLDFEAIFTPSKALALLTTYTATIHSGITDVSGNVLPADHVWTFKTVDGTWGTAGLIEADNAGPATFPQVAVDPNGNAIAVWEQSDGTRENIWANRFTASTGWGISELIETDNAGDANLPAVAIDLNGNAIALWSQSDGTRDNLLANRFTAGSGWGTAVLIETDNTGDAFQQQVAVDMSGNAIAVWVQFDGIRTNIWANRFTTGAGWGIAELLETDNIQSGFSALRPQVSIDTSGNAIAVWDQGDGTRGNIWANRFIAGSGWGTAELIETDNAGHAFLPQVSFDRSGNAIAVWRQSDGTRNNIWSNRFIVGSGWGTAELIESNNAGSANNPQVAIDASGNAIAVWDQLDGTHNIWSNRFITGSGWGTAELIESDNAGSAFFPQLAVDASGNAIAVWYQGDGTRDNIFSNRFIEGIGWGTPQLIESDNTGDASQPQVGLDAGGNAITVWSQSDGTRENIWSNRFQ